MPSDRQIQHLDDIVDAIQRINRLTLGMSFQDFEADERTRLAVERLLQILTEAAHRLGREAHILCPTIDWRDVRDFGNILRHDYDDILAKSVWDSIQDDLPPLLHAVLETRDQARNSKGKLGPAHL